MFETNQNRYNIALPLLVTSFFLFLAFTSCEKQTSNDAITGHLTENLSSCQAVKLSSNSKHFRPEVSPGDFLRLL